MLFLFISIWFLALVGRKVVVIWVLEACLLCGYALIDYFCNVLAIERLIDAWGLRLDLIDIATWVGIGLENALLAAAYVGVGFIILLRIEILIVHTIKVGFVMSDVYAIKFLLCYKITLTHNSTMSFGNLTAHLIILMFQINHSRSEIFNNTFHLFKLPIFIIPIISNQLHLPCHRCQLPVQLSSLSFKIFLFFIIFLNFSFQIVHVNLHLMLESDVPANVGF